MKNNVVNMLTFFSLVSVFAGDSVLGMRTLISANLNAFPQAQPIIQPIAAPSSGDVNAHNQSRGNNRISEMQSSDDNTSDKESRRKRHHRHKGSDAVRSGDDDVDDSSAVKKSHHKHRSTTNNDSARGERKGGRTARGKHEDESELHQSGTATRKSQRRHEKEDEDSLRKPKDGAKKEASTGSKVETSKGSKRKQKPAAAKEERSYSDYESGGYAYSDDAYYSQSDKDRKVGSSISRELKAYLSSGAFNQDDISRVSDSIQVLLPQKPYGEFYSVNDLMKDEYSISFFGQILPLHVDRPHGKQHKNSYRIDGVPVLDNVVAFTIDTKFKRLYEQFSKKVAPDAKSASETGSEADESASEEEEGK